MEELVTIEGGEELEATLDALPEAIAEGILVPAMREAAHFLRDGVLMRAMNAFQARTGKLFRGIQVDDTVTPRAAGGVVIKWRIGMALTPGNQFAFYARFWEDGFFHVGRAKRSKLGARRRGASFMDRLNRLNRGRRGRGVGRDRAVGKPMRKQFMQPAFEARWQEALAIVVRKIRAELDDIAKQAKKAA